MNYLSSSITQMQSSYEVLVVGSGYGAAIAASRLARAGRRVAILERGREWRAGDFPDSGLRATQEMQFDLEVNGKGHRKGSPTALYDFRVNDDINVFLGCGLGGTSLVNANVALKPDPRVMAQTSWPQALRADLNGLVEECYTHASAMLEPRDYPVEARGIKKYLALKESGAALNVVCRPAPINVHSETRRNHVGVKQNACIECGDCITGCNYSAKNTLTMNYLPDAVAHGAEIFTCVEVRSVARRDGGWRVFYRVLDSGRERFDAPELFVDADIVWLGAGTLGSTEILLRSGQRGLKLSSQLGKHFTGNGDFLGFAYNTDSTIQGVGTGKQSAKKPTAVGPCITGLLDLRQTNAWQDGMVIEEGSLPGALAKMLPAFLAGAANASGEETHSGVRDKLRQKARELESLARGAYHGAMQNTQTFLVMAHDDSNGTVVLEDDRPRIHWPAVGQQTVFKRINKALSEATAPLGGTYVKNPMWADWLGKRLITVHPLGGCAMADRAEEGVVDHRGRVFSGTQGSEVYAGLLVGDGAIMPRSLGVNPLLTISALSERAARLLIAEHGWALSEQTASSIEDVAASQQHVGIQFTETMRGFISPQAPADYVAAESEGRQQNQICEFTVTIQSENLDALINDPAHAARMAGTVNCPLLSAKPLTVTAGKFQLLPVDAALPNARRMEYRMELNAEEGRRYFLSGYKQIQDHEGMDIWEDTTRLFIRLHEGTNDRGALRATGILSIALTDFLRQMRTMRVLNARSLEERARALAQFGQFFSGSLYEVYGTVARNPKYFDPSSPPRAVRVLDTPLPKIYPVKTPDGAVIRLTRYQAGNKGPVMLTHGLGVSSRIFTVDTIAVNLLEFLCQNQFDVWLLDYRASISLPTAAQAATGDEIAQQDLPTAVAEILKQTGAKSIQVVAHCFGATTLLMSLLAGLKGVRSVVSSQIGLDSLVPKLTRLKAGLYMPEVLKTLGFDTMTAYADRHADFKERLFDQALRLYPTDEEERCGGVSCARIVFMYGHLYEHAQLNRATHETLHELFGVANLAAMDHLATMVRHKTLVDREGRDVYLPHLDRLALPMLFIHGQLNACYTPEGTEKTVQRLSRANDPKWYRRLEIPSYGHIDCIFGRDAVRDVYPSIVEHLNATLIT